jgi:enterochelin esterase-like enzyme
MPRYWLHGFLGVLLSFTACEQPDRDHEVRFEVSVAEPLPEGARVFLTGDAEPFGGWTPDAVPLEPMQDGRWGTTLTLPPGTVSFKVTRGSWETEAVSADGVVPDNIVLQVRTDTTVSVSVANWKDVIHSVEGQITGTVAYHRQLQGEGLRPRDVLVWLPPSYETAPDRRFPVLYMHDGQNIVDPATSYTGIDWQVDEAVDSLSRTGLMEEVIVVGVYNTPDRTEEYTDTPLGRAYQRFLVEDLKPLIDRTYRTQPGPEHTAIMGSSAGGLASFLAVWYYPDVYLQAACLSPYFPEGLPDSVRTRPWDHDRIRLYLDDGGDELDTRLQEGIDRMMPVLHELGFEEGRNMAWFKDEGAAHNERAWAARVWRPLTFLFGRTPEERAGG